jgi:hypothetical protein
MTQTIQIKRTELPNIPPTALAPGELAIELADPQRLWVGVPGAVDPLGLVQLVERSTVFYELIDPSHWSWLEGINRELLAAVSPVIAAPLDGVPGTSRNILIKGVDATPLTIRFDASLGPVAEVPGVTDTAWAFVRLYCIATDVFMTSASLVTGTLPEPPPGLPEQIAMDDPSHWLWGEALSFDVTVAVNTTIAGPRIAQPYSQRTIRVIGADTLPKKIRFDSSFIGEVPEVHVTDSRGYRLDICCLSSRHNVVTALPFNAIPDWTPGHLPGIVGWYRASKGASSTQWSDYSGLGHDLISKGTTNPVIDPVGLNGQPAVDMVGTDNLETALDTFARGVGDKFSVFAVFKMRAATPMFGGLMSYCGTGMYPTAENNNESSELFLRFMGNDVINTNRNGIQSTVNITLDTTYRAGFIYDGVNVTPYLNNIAGVPVASAGNFSSPGTLCVGKPSGYGWDGPVGEIVITNTALDVDERLMLDEYFVARYP